MLRATSTSRIICLFGLIASFQLYSRALVNPEPINNIFSPNSAEELNELTKSGNVVVDFHGEAWCPPCRMFAPTFAKVAASTSNVIFVKADVDKVKAPGIRTVPTIALYKDGKRVFFRPDALTEPQLRSLIKEKFDL